MSVLVNVTPATTCLPPAASNVDIVRIEPKTCLAFQHESQSGPTTHIPHTRMADARAESWIMESGTQWARLAYET